MDVMPQCDAIDGVTRDAATTAQLGTMRDQGLTDFNQRLDQMISVLETIASRIAALD